MSRPVQGGLTVAALVFVPLLAVAGSDGLRTTLDFTTGVLSLVSLSAAVAWGLLATDRLFLSTRQRIVCQGIHRATAVASLGFLLLHGTVKVALGHVDLIGALIPFGLGVTGTAGLIGFGSLAGLLMVVTAATGALRSAFAQPSPTATRLGQSLGSPREAGGIAGRWRALHGLSYPAWCAALVHGLYAGRAPATWVVVMYGLCLAGVAGVLCLRLLPRPTKRRIADRIAELLGQGPPPAPDPVLRESPSSGAEPWSDPVGWSEPGGDVRGTPVRPRTLSAPIPPAESPPSAIPGSLHESPTETLYGSRAPLYEPPPRSADRITFDPPGDTPVQGWRKGPGPGIAAGYRAVSLGGGPSLPSESRWPSPSPAPPAQAHPTSPAPAHPSPSNAAEHTYAPPQEPPLYASRFDTTPTYGTPEYDTGAPTPYPPPSAPLPSEGAHGPAPTGGIQADATSSYAAPPYGTPSYGTPSYGTPSHSYGTPEYDSGPPTPDSTTTTTPFASPLIAPGAEPPAEPFAAPPAGEPWHAPAGDRP
ncbi:hypothetical protein CIB93_01985 [Streptomyces sp. WZ.A104]|uniref:hypothetical protein n=1 Tax=Streptomyces sp. WZ.A104 TaxID=2023771 RepID=UPI000BBBE05D|nr:hypothetical protein [Streptomyces sp. WZ.A104]PCG87823.1 hypothetical protein CIB93_01985 [Streptomyces sp. WZ.A104]